MKWIHFEGGRGITIVRLFYQPSEKGSTQRGNNLLTLGATFLPFRLDTFSEGVGVQDPKQEVTKFEKNTRCIHSV